MPTYDSSIDNSPITRVTTVDSTGQPLSSDSGAPVSLGSKLAGERNIGGPDDHLEARQLGSYTNLTASALIKTGAGSINYIVVNSHTTGTIKLWDNTSAATTVINNTITLAAGERWIPINARFATGLYVTIGGTADVTVYWN